MKMIKKQLAIKSMLVIVMSSIALQLFSKIRKINKYK